MHSSSAEPLQIAAASPAHLTSAKPTAASQTLLPRPLPEGAFSFVLKPIMMFLLACALSALWCLFTLSTAFAPSSGPEGFALTQIAVFLCPLALIWAVFFALRKIQDLQSQLAHADTKCTALQRELQKAKAAIDDHVNRPAERQLAPLVRDMARPPAVAAQPDVAHHAREAAVDLASPTPGASQDQSRLALAEPPQAERPPLTNADFIRALQFPESPEDQAGFQSLRLALQERELSKLIRAAQDILTLLSQDGIYMDDLSAERSHPDMWRRFAAGERGRVIASLGGVRDRSCLALTRSRMREDPVFRDAAHHFLRMFDKVFQDFEASASDAEIIAFSDSRTSRAFMLIGRCAGVFD